MKNYIIKISISKNIGKFYLRQGVNVNGIAKLIMKIVSVERTIKIRMLVNGRRFRKLFVLSTAKNCFLFLKIC